ncbi:MAG: zinc dependent phospholipase C family protein, partial [Planctomycetales bacterium]|nr:zinc dependent phospholipase C family protein [Planctomycetales bacterium]
MNRLHWVIRNAHCLGTHQRFAVDALTMLQTDAGKRFAAWLLYYHRAFLRGAVDPDIRFRDYHNHILHVRDGYWGGAPRVAHQWYERLQKYLRAERFRDAAHAAGVLSHYVTDVIQPLHTISTDREALVHRPMEWSIDQSYDRIVQRWNDDGVDVMIRLSDKPGWLGSLMMHSAKYASVRSELLVRRYHFQDGVRDPSKGLDD